MYKNNIYLYSYIDIFKEEYIDRYINYRLNNNNLSIEEIVKNVNLNLDYGFYQNIQDALYTNTNLVLSNKTYKLNKNYVPSNLVSVNINYASRNDIIADNEALEHFYMLSNDAKSLGLTIKTISAYRSYEYQEALYNMYLKEDTQEVVDTYSARPGHSEHQTGLAFDVYNIKNSYTDFGITEEYKWLKDNAHKYGFIIRYPLGKEYITGYKYEPWHIRYVGSIAKDIYENNLTLEEYLLNNTSIKIS